MTPRIKNMLFAFVFAAVTIAAALDARAAVTPTLSLNNLGNSQIQINVSGDPNFPATLYYYSQYPNAGQSVGSIGNTSNTGNLSVVIPYGQYNISSGDYVYVAVDGVISSSIQWPNIFSGSSYYNSNNGNYYSISFSQNNISLTSGQSLTISIYGSSGSYYVSQSSPFAGATVNGSNLNITGNSAGSGSIVVCSNNNSCGTLYVTVTAPTYYNYSNTYNAPTSVYPYTSPNTYSYQSSTAYTSYPYATYQSSNVPVLGQDTITLTAGQESSIGVYGNGSYYINSNSNTYAVAARVSSDVLSIMANNPGTASIVICQIGGSCATLLVTVNAAVIAYPYAPTYASVYPYGQSTYSQPAYYYAQPTYFPSITQQAARPIYYMPQPVTQTYSYMYPRNW